MSGSVLFDAPGPRSKRLYAAIGAASIVILLLILWFVVNKLDDKGQLTAAKWKPFLTGEIWTEYLIPGLIGTLKAAAISVVFALVLGVLLGVGRLSAAKWIRWPSSVIVEFFRAVPVLLMMLFAYALYGHYETFPPEQIGNYKSNLVPALIFVGALFVIINYFVSVIANKVEQRTRRRGRSAGGPLAPDQIDQAAVAVAAAAADRAGGQSAI